MNIDNIMQELAKYLRMNDELTAIIDGLKDQLKEYMNDNNLDTIQGIEHKATYKAVTSSRVDTTALKKDMPNIAEKYTKTTTSKRFTFN